MPPTAAEQTGDAARRIAQRKLPVVEFTVISDGQATPGTYDLER